MTNDQLFIGALEYPKPILKFQNGCTSRAMLCLPFRRWPKVYLAGQEDTLTHFAIFYKKHIEWDEAAEVEDINIVFNSHLAGKQNGKIGISIRSQVVGGEQVCVCVSRNLLPISVSAGRPINTHQAIAAMRSTSVLTH